MKQAITTQAAFSELVSIPIADAPDLCYIFWVQEGGGFFSLEDGDYPVTVGTVYCLFGDRRPVLAGADGLKGYVLSFPLEFLQKVKADMNLQFGCRPFDSHSMMGVVVAGPVRAEMEQLLHCMANENRAKSEFKVEILYSLLKVFLIRLIQQTAGAGPGCKRQPVKDDVVNRFIGMVYEHFSTMKKVADYAEILCIAPSYLNIRVKAVTGLTASSLIKQVIITEAKKQVWEKGLSLKEVAYQLGYDDTSHFSKFFKRAAGKNYSSFKRNLVDN